MNTKIVVLGECIHNALKEYTEEAYSSFSANLCGACAVGSGLLVREAKRKFNMNLTFKAAPHHAWTEYRGVIYDITATQFGAREKVFIIPAKSLNVIKSAWHKTQYMSDSINDIDFINEDWPSDQRPINYKVKWLNQYKCKIIRL